MEELFYWVWIASVQGLKTKKVQKLIDSFGSIKNVYYQSKKELMKVRVIEEKTAEQMIRKKDRQKIENIIDCLVKQKIQVIPYTSLDYPVQLKQIYDPPVVLYVKGNISILQNFSIAIVGARQATLYGKQVAFGLAKNLACSGVIVISGLAKGIDTYAHLGTLKAEAKTIAVLGNGIDSIYPKENKELAEQILQKGGAIVSEYTVGQKPEKYHFPARNRIISGLSQGVVVVEAKKKSGSMITVDYALEEGKMVFAVPGRITDVTSEGTNELLMQGAKPIRKIQDILEEY